MSAIRIPRLQDTLRLFCWILGLVIAGCLAWVLSGPLRSERLRDSVNRFWTQAGDSRRLAAALPAGLLEPRLSRLGSWFTLEDEKRALVFTFFAEGSSFPCAAIVNAEKKVEELIALTVNGSALLEKVSPGLKRFYVRRIEGEQ
jgi:hypothetical protein